MTVEPGTFGTLRELNRLRVVDALRRAGTASRSDLARMTGISRTTVATLVSDLQARGLIVEQADGRAEPSGRGRPPVLLRLDAAAGSALGIDFGHSHVRVAVADLSSAVLAERYVELDVDGAPHDALDAAADLATSVLVEAGVDRSRVIGAGMALSAPIDRHQGVVGSTVLPNWAGIQAGEELSPPAGDPRRAGQRRQPRRPRRGLLRRGPRVLGRPLRDDVRAASAPASCWAAASTTARPASPASSATSRCSPRARSAAAAAAAASRRSPPRACSSPSCAPPTAPT